MKQFLLFFLLCFAGNTLSAQQISVLEYQASNRVSYPKDVEINVNWKKDTDLKTIHITDPTKNITLLKGTLNFRLVLVDSFSLYDQFGDKMITGYFKDTVGGTYEEQPVPFSFYGLGGVKSGEFKTYSKATDTAKAEIFLESVANYLNGEKNGKQISYYKNSRQIQLEVYYLKNKPEGAFTQYYENGTFLEVGNYYKGTKHGEWTAYYENNLPSKKEVYKKGLLNGEVKAWHRNGKVALMTSYENEQVNGFYYTYYDNGQIKDSLFYGHGHLHGRNVKYHRNGQKSFECTYDKGLEQSTLRTWNQDGILISETAYVNGMREGMEKIYSEKGILMQSTFIYNDLSFVETITYHANGKMQCRTRHKITEQKISEECWDEKGKKISSTTSSTEGEKEEEIELPPNAIDQINEQEMVTMYDVWEDPTLNFILAPTEAGKKTLAKIKGLKFILTVKNRNDYTVSLSPDNADSKKGKKALPMLQTAFQVKPLMINGARYKTTLVFTME